MSAQGKFIVFEGGEGSGKSSHCNLTAEYLKEKGLAIILTHEPGGTKFGQQLRAILLQHQTNNLSATTELLLFLADRAQHVTEFIQPTLVSGVNVLCDRFTGSTLAYQIGGRKLKNELLIKQMEQLSRQALKPDLVIYLDIDPKIGLQRKHKQLSKGLTCFDQEEITFHQAVRAYFQQLASTDPNWVSIDANREIGTIQAEINALIDKLFI